MNVKNQLKSVLIPLLFFSFGFTGFSQEINFSEHKVEQLISKTWKVDKLNEEGRNLGLEGLKNQKYVFTKDHSYKQVLSESENVRGKWEYFPDKNYIVLSMKGRPFAKIISLKKNEMTLMSRAYPKAKIYCTPLKKSTSREK